MNKSTKQLNEALGNMKYEITLNQKAFIEGCLQYLIDTIDYGLESGESPQQQKQRAEKVLSELRDL